MDRENVKERAKTMLGQYLDATTNKKGKKYICPLCGSGSGKNGHYTPAFSVNENKWKCFSCNQGGDIFTLIALQNNLDSQRDFQKVLKIAADTLNLPVNDTSHSHRIFETKTEGKVSYKDFLSACQKDAHKTDYYAKRGLQKETIERFGLGFLTSQTIKRFKMACNLESYFSNGDIVIPYCGASEYFIARETQTGPNCKRNDKFMKWKKPKTKNAGKEPVYNESELDKDSDEPIFITEAPLDSISIMQASGAAIAIGGTGPEKLETALDKRPEFNRTFAIAFDNPKQDSAGAMVAEKVKAILQKRNINYIEYVLPDGVKDCNAYLMAHRDDFYASVRKCKAEAKNALEAAKKQKYDEYNKDSAAMRLKEFIQNMKTVDTPSTPTGFSELDGVLDGGLYEGLYIVGAVSSLGKTTLVLQICDQIAQYGQDVLIFSLEMAASELIAKSISRQTLMFCREHCISNTNAKTARGVTDRSRYGNYTHEEKNVLNEALKAYNRYAGNIVIKQGLGDIGVSEIRATVEQHLQIRGKKPVVVVDYLQILAPYNDRLSDKQNTDKSVLELKRISRDYKTPVIAISSFNRDNYTSAASMCAFKESGAIEYSSDVLIAVQPQGMKDSDKIENKITVDTCKTMQVRPIEVVVLKNRNGAAGCKVKFNYHALFNFFEESSNTFQELSPESFNPFI